METPLIDGLVSLHVEECCDHHDQSSTSLETTYLKVILQIFNFCFQFVSFNNIRAFWDISPFCLSKTYNFHRYESARDAKSAKIEWQEKWVLKKKTPTVRLVTFDLNFIGLKLDFFFWKVLSKSTNVSQPEPRKM